ncbi:YiiX/YebB-like N1pC/P60 family cysteine hydrolase [Bacteriovorax sp. Seq25_V]|uniref:YiiX/YebB-like N1pC/P60 family cysteine hydrolase n=1 Tax=Bacteriovorax sp. Seq25_V TaxID=1201288 RepID=UPI000389F046|nr:YiiX/YebB-like N1pC/P60 family cysteine hydrolase [Bacteriovorax sp. Seq25_V]EQC46271.1 orthopoxovirus protein, PF05708 family [Bacteriovorax sp. Seq25_V]
MVKYLIPLVIAANSLASAGSTQSINYRLMDITDQVKGSATSKAAHLNNLEVRKEMLLMDLDTSSAHNDIIKQEIINNTENLKSLIQKTDKFLAISQEFSTRVVDQLSSDNVLRGDDLSTIDNLIRTLLIIADLNMEMINYYHTDSNISGIFKSSNEEAIEKHLIKMGAITNLFNLFDTAYKQFFTNSRLRRIVIDIYKTQSKQYPNITRVHDYMKTVNTDKYREMTKQYAVEFANSRIDLLHKLNPLITRLVVVNEQQAMTKRIVSEEFDKFKYIRGSDTITAIFGKFTNFVSGLFGNLVGKIRWRNGYLFKHEWGEKFIAGKLKPLDIISEKTPFAATDLFIPGHFGHIALYLGTEAQLREVGLWNDPIIAPYQEQIRNGKVILESIRPGSRLTTIEDFMQIDEITLVRQPKVLENLDRAKQIYKVAFEQLGKDYDFNFDVHTLDKVVCSEVVYHAYGDIKWPTAYIFGRFTISPDDVVSLSLWDKSPVGLDISIIGNKENEVKRIDIKDMAENLSFKYNKKRSKSLGKPAFDKVTKKCYMRQRNVGNDDHRNFGRKQYVKVCNKSYTQLVYGQ